MITYDDLKHLLEKLYKTCETNKRALNSENLNWQQTRNQIRVLLQQILSGIGITGKYLPGVHSNLVDITNLDIVNFAMKKFWSSIFYR